ncbi:MAG: class I SAM-dependent methyltransferase [Acidobacteria bacterium]|nr:class I SAM-dependent methyltransferase [Acidobacteriota bacterium]
MLVTMAQYDAIAAAYQDSKQLPFRKHVERHTLFEALGDVRGLRVLDLACGEGFYTRLLRIAGAAEVTGVDISGEMIALAERQERENPLGCRYVCSDAAEYRAAGAVDLVVAMYLLHYAGSAGKLLRFLKVAHAALRPGGRLVGFNDNVLSPPRGTVSWSKYGIVKTGPAVPTAGAPIRYRLTNPDGASFEFDSYYESPETYRRAFDQAGFREFRWLGVSLDPAERQNSFWDEFLENPPVIGFAAAR